AAAASCGVPVRSAGSAPSSNSISIIEQGSGACLWRADDPLPFCDAYQPGLSDHDYEVFMPAAFFTPDGPTAAAKCVANTLISQFSNDDGSPKEIDLGDGTRVSFPDITFFPMSRDEFEVAKLNVQPPKNDKGTDTTGDLG